MIRCCLHRWKTARVSARTTFFANQLRGRQIGNGVRCPKIAVRSVTTGMNDALGNTLMIKMKYLLANVKVFQRCQSTRACLHCILIVCNGDALRARQERTTHIRGLVRFSAVAGIALTFDHIVSGLHIGRGRVDDWFRSMQGLSKLKSR